MSKIVSLSRLLVLCSLLVGVVGVASASAAEPEPFKDPSLKVCKKVPAGFLGLYTESNCETNARSGTWDWATADTESSTWYCLLWTNGTNRYSDSLCQSASSTGQFEVKLNAGEAFPKELGTSGLSVLKGELAGAKAEIDCTADTFKAQPVTGTETKKATIKYTGCTSVKPANCEVAGGGEPAKSILTSNLIGKLSTLRLITFSPETGATFVGIEYSGASCTLKGQTLPVEGSQMCTFVAGTETPAAEHELVCLASESNLLFGKKAATYEGRANIMIEGGLLWKIR